MRFFCAFFLENKRFFERFWMGFYCFFGGIICPGVVKKAVLQYRYKLRPQAEITQRIFLQLFL